MSIRGNKKGEEKGMLKVSYGKHICELCGKEFIKGSSRQIYCTKTCTEIAQKKRRKERRGIRQGKDNITSIQKQAQAMGMSYGQYVAEMYKKQV